VTVIEARGGHRPVPALATKLPRVRLASMLDADGDPVADEDLRLVRARVCRAGWIAVGSREDAAVYSVGLTRWGWPELVVPLAAAATVEFALWLLAELVGRAVQYGRVPEPGMVYVNHSSVLLRETEPGACRIACAMYRGCGTLRALCVESPKPQGAGG
jgi:hypothetical protein